MSYFKNGTSAEVLEENNYYPFGLKHEGYNPTAGNLSYQYKYNGVELQQESGMYAMDWRSYMPELGRFSSMDILSESYDDTTPYHFALNNPVFYSDPTGMYTNTHNGYLFTKTEEIAALQQYFRTENSSVSGLGGFMQGNETFKVDIPGITWNGKGNKDTWNLGNNYLFNSYAMYNAILQGLNSWNFQTKARATSEGLAGVKNDGPIQYVGGADDPLGIFEVGGIALSAMSGGKGNYILAALMITRSGNTTGLKMLAAEKGILKAELAIEQVEAKTVIGNGGMYIPKTPLAQHNVGGWDIPLPSPLAGNYPHTTLGGKIGSDGILYRQSATFTGGSWPLANGKIVPWSRVDWTTHGRPLVHPNPHQHIFNFNGKNWQYGKAVSFP